VKTISLKKVSAIAVAALAIGSTSAIAPAYSAEVANGAAIGGLNSLTLAKVTATPTVNSVVVVKLGMSINAIASNPAASNTYKIQGSLTTVPSGGSVALSSVTTGVGVTQTGTLTPIIATAGTFFTATPLASVVTFTAAAGGAVLGTYPAETDTRLSAQTVTNVGGYNFTPTKAGTYVLTVWQDTNGTGDTPSVGEVSQTLSITVAAASGWSTGGTTVYSAPATANTLSTATTDKAPQAASSVLGTKGASLLVNLRDTDGALYTGQTVTATVSGPGFVGGASAALTGTAPTGTQQDTADGAATTTRTASVVDTTGFVAFGVWGDGTAGTSSVAISVTDKVSGATTVIATKTVTFFGDVAKLEIVKSNFKIGKAGSTTGAADGNLAARNLAGEVTNAGALNAATTTPSIILKATDSGGRVANTVAVPTVVSSNGNVVSGGTCVLDDGLDTTYSSGGTGFYNCNFDTAAAAVSGGAAKLTFRIVDPADATLFITTATSHDVTVGGSVSTETITFDKTAYAPGEAMVVTRTAKDSAGNPVADGTAAPALTFSKSVGGTAPGASTYVGGTKATSATAPTVFAPAIAGAFTVTATSGATGSPTITASSSVTDANAGLLTQIDALNAKIVALNALIAKIMKKLGVK
jgi:hypothetical protein